MVQIWPGLMSPDLHTNSPGHIWTTLLYIGGILKLLNLQEVIPLCKDSM